MDVSKSNLGMMFILPWFEEHRWEHLYICRGRTREGKGADLSHTKKLPRQHHTACYVTRGTVLPGGVWAQGEEDILVAGAEAKECALLRRDKSPLLGF